MRPSKTKVYMDIATTVSKRSHDDETQVGAALVKNDTGAVVATGYNGFIRGAPDGKLPTVRPDKYQYMQHAEINVISNCARHGIAMDNCTIYVTMSPCSNCMRTLWQSGITEVVCKELYHDFDKILNMKDLKITMSSREDYHVLTYGVYDGN